MTKIYRNNEETGRSMVEMLGVLAIVGVLSIGGIAGYSKAMAKYKINKTLDQVSLIITNIRTLYGNQVSYYGLNNKAAIDYEIVSRDIVAKSAGGSGSLVNPFAGDITINATKDTNTVTTAASNSAADCGSDKFCPTYRITYTGMDKSACAAIASADWGSSASAGLVAFFVNSVNHNWSGTKNTSGAADNNVIPLDYATAYKQCSSLDNNSITWFYN